jgi:hypothetical protein
MEVEQKIQNEGSGHIELALTAVTPASLARS